MSEQEKSGLSRRDFLKRGAALGGAVVWATPVVQMIGMHPALAQETSPTCNFIYAVKLELVDSVPTCTDIWDQNATDVSTGQGHCLDVVAATNGKAQCGGCQFSPELTVNSDHEWVVTLDKDCQYFDSAIDLKTGEAGGGCDAAFTPEFIDSRTLKFTTEPGTGTGISHVEIVFCCAHEPPEPC